MLHNVDYKHFCGFYAIELRFCEQLLCSHYDFAVVDQRCVVPSSTQKKPETLTHLCESYIEKGDAEPGP